MNKASKIFRCLYKKNKTFPTSLKDLAMMMMNVKLKTVQRHLAKLGMKLVFTF